MQAVTHYEDASILATISTGLGQPMSGIDINKLPEEELLAGRGW